MRCYGMSVRAPTISLFGSSPRRLRFARVCTLMRTRADTKSQSNSLHLRQRCGYTHIMSTYGSRKTRPFSAGLGHRRTGSWRGSPAASCAEWACVCMCVCLRVCVCVCVCVHLCACAALRVCVRVRVRVPCARVCVMCLCCGWAGVPLGPRTHKTHTRTHTHKDTHSDTRHTESHGCAHSHTRPCVATAIHPH